MKKLAFNQINFSELKLGRMEQKENADGSLLKVDYLPNFLDPYESFIKFLITRLTDFFIINTSVNNSNTYY